MAILAQDSWVQVWHDRQLQTEGECQAGEEITLFTGRHRTVVYSLRQWEDLGITQFGYLADGTEATPADLVRAQARLKADDYGPLFVDHAGRHS